MSQGTIEERLSVLERQVAELVREKNEGQGKEGWLDEIKGSFKDDPEFDEILRLGREFREADRPGDDGPPGAD